MFHSLFFFLLASIIEPWCIAYPGSQPKCVSLALVSGSGCIFFGLGCKAKGSFFRLFSESVSLADTIHLKIWSHKVWQKAPIGFEDYVGKCVFSFPYWTVAEILEIIPFKSQVDPYMNISLPVFYSF